MAIYIVVELKKVRGWAKLCTCLMGNVWLIIYLEVIRNSCTISYRVLHIDILDQIWLKLHKPKLVQRFKMQPYRVLNTDLLDLEIIYMDVKIWSCNITLLTILSHVQAHNYIPSDFQHGLVPCPQQEMS